MRYYGAVEAGGTKMVCAVGDADGQIVDKCIIPTDIPSKTMPQMLEYFQKQNICALGVGCFGLLDLDPKSKTYGSITTTPKLHWRNYPILQTFQQELGIPVGIDTDVNAAALGEATWGCTQDVDTSIYITVGTGIGVGVILNGKTHHGMIHPEAGHISVAMRPDDPIVEGVCPYHGNCLEGLASGPALEKRWGQPAQKLQDCEAVWELEAYYLAQAICTYIYTFSPERIVLGGGVCHQKQLLPLIREKVNRQLCGYIQGKGLNNLDRYIVASSLNDQQGIMGCLRIAMEALNGGTK